MTDDDLPPTGDAAVDAALDRLRTLDGGTGPADLDVLTEVYEALHQRLTAAAE